MEIPMNKLKILPIVMAISSVIIVQPAMAESDGGDYSSQNQNSGSDYNVDTATYRVDNNVLVTPVQPVDPTTNNPKPQKSFEETLRELQGPAKPKSAIEEEDKSLTAAYEEAPTVDNPDPNQDTTTDIADGGYSEDGGVNGDSSGGEDGGSDGGSDGDGGGGDGGGGGGGE
jgi:hypothetical protein